MKNSKVRIKGTNLKGIVENVWVRKLFEEGNVPIHTFQIRLSTGGLINKNINEIEECEDYLYFEVGDKVVLNSNKQVGIIKSIEKFHSEALMKDEYMLTVQLNDDTNVRCLMSHVDVYQEKGWSLWEVLDWLEVYNYPDGLVIRTYDDKHVLVVNNKSSGVTIIDKKVGLAVQLDNEYIKAKYFIDPYVKEISKKEIMEKFNCEDFKIID